MLTKLISEQDRLIQIQQQLGQQVHEAVLSETPVDQIIKDICDRLLELLKANYITVFIRENSDSENQKIKVHYLNVSRELQALLGKAENLAGISRNDLEIELDDQSMYRDLYESRKILEINDHQKAIKSLQDKVTHNRSLRKLAPTVARLFGKKLDYSYYLPLIAQDEMIGHLEIGRTKDNIFTDNEKNILQSIVLEMAVAIEYRRKQAGIQTIRDMFNQLSESSDDNIYYKDSQGRFMYLNPAMALSLRLENSQDAIGKKESELLEQDHVFQREEHERTVIESKKEKSFVDTMKLDDDVFKYFYRSIIPYYDNQGIFRGILGIDRDITELQHNVNKISLSEDWYQALFDSSKDGIVLLKGAILQDCNPKMLEIFGISREEAVGKSPFDFSPEYQADDQQSRGLGLRYLSKALSGEPQTFKWLHQNKSGEIIPTVVSLRRLTVNHHTYLVAVVQKVDDIKTLKEAIVDKAREIDLFFNLSMDNILIIDLEGRVERASPQWQRDLGYQEEELVGHSILELIHPDDIEETKGAMGGLAEGKEVVDFVNRYLAADGSYHYLEWRSRSYQGKIYGAARDISDRYQREEALKVSELKYRQLFEQMLDAYAIHEIVTDDQGKPVDYIFLEANPAFEQMTGLNAENIIGKRVKELLPQTEDHWIQNYGKVALENESMSFTQYSQDLGKYYQMSAFSPGNGKFATIFRDVTEDRKREDQTSQALKKAQELDQLKTDFLNRMSHETRTPLSSILGLAEVLKDQEYDEEKLNQIETILESGRKLLSLINNMLELSSVEAGNVVLQKKQVVLPKLLQGIKKSYRASEANNIELRLEIPKAYDTVSIKTDDVKLKQIFQHLLNNAYKFSSQGTITFGYLLRDKQLVLFVQDEGIGFSEEGKRIAFDNFEQTEGGTTRTKGGVGIGLTIVKKYVQLLGGDIEILSEQGKGSRFEFTIKHDPITPQMEKIENKGYDGRGHIILVAEDEAINMMMAEMILKNSNYTVLRAINGKEALEKAANRMDITAVLMDISMPVMDGFEATREIKKIRPEIPVYAVTAHSRSDIQQKMDENKFDDYFNKPYNKKDILDKLQELVDRDSEEDSSK